MSNLQVLLIDDNPAVAKALELAFRIEGHKLQSAASPEQAYSLLARCHYDAILLDLNYTAGQSNGREGLDCLSHLLSDDPSVCVVVLTAHGGMKTAVTAMQAGARDFVIKPWSNADLIAKVASAVLRQPAVTSRTSTDNAAYTKPPLRLLGESPAIQQLRELIQRVGPTRAGVAVTGPSGAGRMLTASLVHGASEFSGSLPVTIDLRDEAAWSRLSDAQGTVILRHAEKLDEIMQERLLSRLTSAIRPVSILANVDELNPALRRQLATVILRVPPLSEREEDAPLLARHFINDAAARFSCTAPILLEGALGAMRAAGWPDDVRGLALSMERAVLLADKDGVIDHIPVAPEPGLALSSAQAGGPEPAFNLDRVEKALIERALAEYSHNVSHAARALGLSRGALYRRMERHGL